MMQLQQHHSGSMSYTLKRVFCVQIHVLYECLCSHLQLTAGSIQLMSNMNILITFVWIAAHRGIQDKESVDVLAEQALKQKEVVDI